MPATSPNALAILGAGPIGLETLAHALELGFDAHVFERAEPGAHLVAWGHVRMFTPWSMNVGPATARLLAKNGIAVPAGSECPTGLEFAEQVLQKLVACPELKGRVHAHSQVVQVARHGARKGDLLAQPERATHPFRLLVRDAGGRESYLHAHGVVDATGTYGTPNAAGTGGIPARGESYLAPQMSYHPDDVQGLRRDRHAGKTTIVIGNGASALTTVAALARLALEVPATRAIWITRRDTPGFAHESANDPLPARAALYAEGRRLQSGAVESVKWVGGCEVEGFEYNSATHRYRVNLARGGVQQTEEADQVIVNCGYGPDTSLHRELQIHECYASLAPMKLAAALLDSGASDCTSIPAFGAAQLANPEPNYFIVGAKSYGRGSQFLLQTGYTQVADVLAALTESAGLQSPARA